MSPTNQKDDYLKLVPAELRARLDKARGTSVKLSAEEDAEARVREEIAAEEKRIADERERKRKLDNARILDNAKRKAGPEAVVDLVDLGDAGVYVMRNPPTLASDALQGAIRDKGRADPIDVANFVIASMVHPDPEEGDNGVRIRDTFDRFGFAAQSLSNVAMTLGGLKIQETRRKS